MTQDDKETYLRDGFVVIKHLCSEPEVGILREALEQDESLVKNQIVLNDDNKGKTKLALWSKPGDGTLGMFTRSERVVHSME